MPRILRRESARRDLTTQWVWCFENASPEIAEKFIQAVEKTLYLLAIQPLSGAVVPTATPKLKGLRRFCIQDGFDKSLAFYFPLEDGIDLVRIVHGNRDLERLFTEM